MSRTRLALAAVAATLIATSALAAPPADLPAAIFTDPPADAAHPARMEVLHIPSHGVEINGVAYLAAGPGPHPTVVLFHGLPGNEKNLDLAQAIRRAGWHAVTFNYRGAWGSPGVFRFRQNLEDADAILAYIRAPAVAAKLGIDTGKLVILGHSMGGWVVINTAAHDHGLAGLVTYSAADMGARADAPHAALAAAMASNKEALAGVTADSMADDIATLGDTSFAKAAPGLKNIPYLDLTSDDGLAPSDEALAAAIRAQGGTKVTLGHAATDHGWSGHRIDLEARVITWLQALK